MGTSPEFFRSQEPLQEKSSRQPTLLLVGSCIASLLSLLLVSYLFVTRGSSSEQLASVEADLAKTSEKMDQLAAKVEQTQVRLTQVRGQLQSTSQKASPSEEELERTRSLADSIRREQHAREEKLLAQIGQVKQESEAKIGQVSTELGGAKGDIESTRKDLEATNSKLERTIGDMGVMSGLIAHNRDELAELKRRGDRNVYEFDLRKAKTLTRVGPIQLALQKVDTKHLRYTMTVQAQDKSVEKKDKTINEPVQFYMKGARSPYEIVVFEVSRDRAVGYLTTPKESAPQR